MAPRLIHGVPPRYPAQQELGAKEASKKLRSEITGFLDEAENVIKAREEFSRRHDAARNEWAKAERKRLGLDKMTMPNLPDEIATQIKQRVQREVLEKYNLDDFETVPRLQIRAPAGLGKTSITFDELAKRRFWNGRIIDYYVPTVDLAKEQASKIATLGLPVRIFKGRGAKDMCDKRIAAIQTAALGLNVFSTLCKRKAPDGREIACPYYAHCPYIAQWKDRGPEVRIFVHAYLGLPRPQPDGKGLSPPDLVIVDERAVTSMIRHESFGVDRLDGPVMQAVLDHLDSGTDLSAAMRTYGVTAKDARRRAEELREEFETSVAPSMNEAETLSHLQEFVGLEKSKLAQFYDRIAAEIDLDRPFHGIEVRANERVNVDGKTESLHHVNWSLKPQFGKRTPLLIIDADADIEINRRFFGDDLTEVEIRAARNAHVTQCSSSRLSKRTLLGPNPKKHPQKTVSLGKVIKIIHQEVARGHHVLAVMPKQVRKFLCAPNSGEKQNARYEPSKSEKWNGATITHFGAIRGSDDYKDFDTVIIVGREEPNPRAMEEQARAIWADDPEPLQFKAGGRYREVPLGYRMRDGSLKGVMTPIHPDHRVQRLLEFARENEMVQAIDRLRLIHALHPKRVIVLCSIPLDITVDKLATLDQLAGTPGRLGATGRMQAAMERHGIVPLGERDLFLALCENPFESEPIGGDLFPRQSSAHDALKKARRTTRNGSPENGGQNQIYNLFGIAPHLRRAKYRRVGQRGQSSTAIYDPTRVPIPIADLSLMIGELVVEFRDITRDDMPSCSASVDLETGEIVNA